MQEVHSTEPELKKKCTSNITVHINIYKIRIYVRQRLFSISPRPPDYSNPPIIVILKYFQPPPPRLFSPLRLFGTREYAFEGRTASIGRREGKQNVV